MDLDPPSVPAVPRRDPAGAPDPFGYAAFVDAIASTLRVDPQQPLRQLADAIAARADAWEASHLHLVEVQARLDAQADTLRAESQVKDAQIARLTAAYQHLLASVHAMLNG